MRERTCLFSALVGLLALGLVHSRAAAAPTPSEAPQLGTVALHWVRLEGAEACITGDALARVVEAKLRRSVFPAARDASTLIEGHVAKTDAGFVASLHMRDARGAELGTRQLSSSDTSCRELSETLGVVLAVMIDPDAAKRASSAVPVAPEPQKDSATSKRPENNRTLAFARVLVGLTRTPLYGLGAAYERTLGVAGGLRLEGAFFFENTDEEPPGDKKSLLRVAYAGVAYCPLWLTYTKARIAACAGAELGGVKVRDVGVDAPSDDSSVWVSASASARLAFVLYGPLEMHVGAGLAGYLNERLLTCDSAAPACTERTPILPQNHSAPIGGVFDLGLGARF
jgi:hypothetical protein